MCVTDFDTADVWHERAVIARKPHRCSECRGRILAREMYIKITMYADDEWVTSRLCQGCDAIWFVMTHVICARRPADWIVHPGSIMVGGLAGELRDHDSGGRDEQDGAMLALVVELRCLYKENREMRRAA